MIIKMNLSQQNKAMIKSYMRSIVGAASATYAATQDWKLTLNALWAAAIPVLMRYLDSSDSAFGKK